MNFFAIFLEFSISRRVGTRRNDTFYILSFPAFSIRFCLEMKPLWYFLIFWIFLLFCWNFQLRDRQERNGMRIFIFSISHHFPTYFGLKWAHCGIFFIFQLFCYFFGIFYFASGRNETEWYFLYALFPGIFHPILAWNEAIVVFFNFLNFFAILLEFSITRRAGAKRNDNFYFLSFSSFSNLF